MVKSAKAGLTVVNRNFDDEVDSLFRLPLADFTPARNVLAARLKKDGRANDATLVKTLSKPSISAWAVNQLYWKHRKAFDRLAAAGQRLQDLQRSGRTGKVSDVRASLDARRDALVELSDLATSLLSEAGHSPTLDTIRRITISLEAISSYPTPSNGLTVGRLTQDVDPPGFESLVSLMTGAVPPKSNTLPTRVAPSQKSAVTKVSQRAAPSANEQKKRQLEEARGVRIAAAKLSLQDAKRSLTEARAKAQRLEAAQKKAHAEVKRTDAEAKQAGRQLREAEERFKRSRAAAEDAAERSDRITSEATEASKAVEDAKRNAEKAGKELESLFRNR